MADFFRGRAQRSRPRGRRMPDFFRGPCRTEWLRGRSLTGRALELLVSGGCRVGFSGGRRCVRVSEEAPCELVGNHVGGCEATSPQGRRRSACRVGGWWSCGWLPASAGSTSPAGCCLAIRARPPAVRCRTRSGRQKSFLRRILPRRIRECIC